MPHRITLQDVLQAMDAVLTDPICGFTPNHRNLLKPYGAYFTELHRQYPGAPLSAVWKPTTTEGGHDMMHHHASSPRPHDDAGAAFHAKGLFVVRHDATTPQVGP